MILTAPFAAVVFASPWMLGFLAATLLPWTVSWIRRSRPRSVSFATVDWVVMAAQGRPCARRISEWIVPMARTAMIALIALAVARPSLMPSSSPTAGDDWRPSLIVMLDDSPDARSSRAIRAAIEAIAEEGMPAWRVEQLSTRQAEASKLPEDAAIVVVCDGVLPQGRLRTWIAARIRAGGGLLVLLGPESSGPSLWRETSSWLTDTAAVEIDGPWAPASTAATGPVGIEASLSADARVPIRRIPGPTCTELARISPLSDWPPGSRGGSLSGPLLLARTVDEHASPMLLVRKVAAGRVAVSAVPWSPDAVGSDLPAWPAFVRLVETTLASTAATAMPAGSSADSREAGLAGVCLIAAVLLAAIDPWLVRLRDDREGVLPR